MGHDSVIEHMTHYFRPTSMRLAAEFCRQEAEEIRYLMEGDLAEVPVSMVYDLKALNTVESHWTLRTRGVAEAAGGWRGSVGRGCYEEVDVWNGGKPDVFASCSALTTRLSNHAIRNPTMNILIRGVAPLATKYRKMKGNK